MHDEAYADMTLKFLQHFLSDCRGDDSRGRQRRHVG